MLAGKEMEEERRKILVNIHAKNNNNNQNKEKILVTITALNSATVTGIYNYFPHYLFHISFALSKHHGSVLVCCPVEWSKTFSFACIGLLFSIDF